MLAMQQQQSPNPSKLTTRQFMDQFKQAVTPTKKVKVEKWSTSDQLPISKPIHPFYLPFFIIQDTHNRTRECMDQLVKANPRISGVDQLPLRTVMASHVKGFFSLQESFYKRFNYLGISYYRYLVDNNTSKYLEVSKISETQFSRVHMLLLSSETRFGKTILVKMLEQFSSSSRRDSYIVLKVPAGQSISAWMDGGVDKIKVELDVDNDKNNNQPLQSEINRRFVVIVMEEFDVDSPTFKVDLQKIKEVCDNINNQLLVRIKYKNDLRIPCPLLVLTTNNPTELIESKLIAMDQYGPIHERLQISSFDIKHTEMVKFFDDLGIVIPLQLHQDIYYLNPVLELRVHSEDNLDCKVVSTSRASDQFQLTAMGFQWINVQIGKLHVYINEMEQALEVRDRMQTNLSKALLQDGTINPKKKGRLGSISNSKLEQEIMNCRKGRLRDFFLYNQIVTASICSINLSLGGRMELKGFIGDMGMRLKDRIRLSSANMELVDQTLTTYHQEQLHCINDWLQLEWLDDLPLIQELDLDHQNRLVVELDSGGLGYFLINSQQQKQDIKSATCYFKLNVLEMNSHPSNVEQKDQVYLKLALSFIKLMLKCQYVHSCLKGNLGEEPLMGIVKIIISLYNNILLSGLTLRGPLSELDELNSWTEHNWTYSNQMDVALAGIEHMSESIIHPAVEIESSNPHVFSEKYIKWDSFKALFLDHLGQFESLNGKGWREWLGRVIRLIE